MNKAVCLLLLAVLFVPALGCDKATPVAPAGTTITLSASPTEITSVSGSSTLTAVVLRSNGSPVNPGTQVRFETTLGTIDPVVETDRSGIATATLRGDGRLGTADVRASSGNVRTEPLKVTIGTAAKTITLQPTPTTIPESGGRVTLRALVRDSRGQALANQGVNFTTELGRLTSGGALRQTDANGQATDTLIVDEQDLANNPASVTVGAQTAGGDGVLVSATFEVQVVSEELRASFTCRRGGVEREVIFDSSVSGGSGSFQYRWDFDDGSSGPEQDDQNPRHTYAGTGNETFTVVLTVIDNSSSLSDVAVGTITVPVSGACGGS